MTPAIRRCVLVASSALAFAGCTSGERPLATIDDREITREDYLRELDYFFVDGETLESAGLTPRAFLEQVVRYRILLDEAQRTFDGLDPTDAARFALFQEGLVREALLQELFPEPLVFDEAELRRRYEARAVEERSLFRFATTKQALAEEAVRRARGGEAFDAVSLELARANPDVAEAGSLGFNPRGFLPVSWESVAFSLRDGEVSDPFSSSEGRTTVLRCDAIRVTPYETLRPVIVAELEREVLETRATELDAELLRTAGYAADSVTIALVARRFSAHGDSLTRRGVDPGSVGMPPFPEAERSLPLFRVGARPFTVEALLSELALGPFRMFQRGEERAGLHEIARNRAISMVLQIVAANRGIYQKPEVQERLLRKRDELVLNMFLRELWRGVAVTESEIRTLLSERGQEAPGEATLRQLRDQRQKELRDQRLEQLVQELVARHEIRYYPERLEAVMASRES